MSVDSPARPLSRSPLFDRAALLALAPLAIALVAVAVWAPWHSNYNVDTLTHWEQIRSVAQFGSLGFDNGSTEDLPELETRFFFVQHGRTWGAYPAGLAYLMALPTRIGGFRGCIRALWFMLAVTAALSYVIVRRSTNDRWLGVASAYVVVLATSLGVYATQTTPYIPAAMFLAGSVLALQHAWDRATGSARAVAAALSGFCAAAAVSCHLIASLSWLAIGAVFLAQDEAPWLRRFGNGIAYGIGSAPPMLLLAATNHVRYETWNPIAYAKCGVAPWNPCNDVIERYQASSGALAALRFLPVVIGIVVAVRLMKRTKIDAIAVLAMGIASLFGSQEGMLKVQAAGRGFWVLLVDSLSMDIGMTRGSENLGSFPGWPAEMPFCVRSIVQCSPFVVAAAFAGARAVRKPEHRASVLGLAAVVGGMIAMVIIRGSMGGTDVYGFSTLNFRYLSPMLPSLVILACIASSDLPWRWPHAIVAVALSFGAAAWFTSTQNDLPHPRRVISEWAPLAIASVVLLAFVVLRVGPKITRGVAGHVAAVALLFGVAWGAGVALGSDRIFALTIRRAQDERTVELARCTPQRFLLLGGYALDDTLALQDERDIHWINVGMGRRDGLTARRLVLDSIHAGRPAFLIQDNPNGPWHFYWQGLRFETMPNCPRVLRIVESNAPRQ